MFEKLEIFRMSHAMATHAGSRQALIAQNIANADTPGFAPRDIGSFSSVFKGDTATFRPTSTREGHMMTPRATSGADARVRSDAMTDPNGNAVSLESEMIHAVGAKREHDQALAIYRSSLSILRSAISTR